MEYRRAHKNAYCALRDALERVIETVVLNDLIKRHDSQMRVGQIARMLAWTQEDMEQIKQLWHRCSKRAHMEPAVSGGVFVPPSQIMDDIKELIEIRDRISDNRNKQVPKQA